MKHLFYRRRKFFDDDFDWDTYGQGTSERRLKRAVRPMAALGQLSFDPESGTVQSGAGEVHPNQQLILEAIGKLQPATVHEVGCGGGTHLATAKSLFPTIGFTGGDRGAGQLELAIEQHPELKGHLGLQDVTMPFCHQWPRAELVFTQAVLMHIHTAVSHFVALSNIVRQAQKFVLLVENYQCHNFVRDIETLYETGHLAWEHLSIHRIDGSGGARGILLSKTPLDLPVLRTDLQIRDGEEPSIRRLMRADEGSLRGLFGFDPA